MHPPSATTLQVSRYTAACSVLGPGKRGVIWVQGCPFRCPGCVAKETLPLRGGDRIPVDSLITFYAGNQNIEGVTFSGGEPMAQAEALVSLVDGLLETRPDLTFMSYTGFQLETLLKDGTPPQRALLERLDILVDGPYEQENHCELLWRGSSNQTVHFLTDRYHHLENAVDDYRGSQIEFEIDRGGELAWMGIPPRGFREKFESSMAARGIHLKVTSSSSITEPT